MLKKYYNIALRDALVASLLVMVISAITGYVVYNTSSAGLKKEVQSGLLVLAKTAANLTNGDLHQKITRSEQKNSPLYEKIRKPFFGLLKANPNLEFIYTAIEKEGKIFFILDSKILEEGEEDDTSDVMEEYSDATDYMLQALKNHTPQVEDEPYSDSYGTFLSGYAPIFDSSNKFIGIVGADINVDDYLKTLAKVKKALFIGLTIAFIASIFVGIAVYTVRNASIKAEAKNREQQKQMAEMERLQVLEREQQKIEAEQKRKQDMARLAENFEQTVKGLVSNVVSSAKSMQSGASSVVQIAEQTKNSSTNVARASNETSEVASQVSEASEELYAAITEISAQTLKSSAVVNDALEKAEIAKSSIESLSKKSINIGSVINMINNIATKINLLALNATIEAARAGKGAEGFEVVASEVKALANQVSRATKEISEQIGQIQEASSISVKSVMDIIGIIDIVSNNTLAIATAVEEQTAVTSEIAKSISYAAVGTSNITRDIGFVLQGAGSTEKTANDFLTSTTVLNQQSELLNKQVDEFIKVIKS